MARKRFQPVRSQSLVVAGRVPKTLAASVHAEARRRGISVSALVAEVLAERFDSSSRDPLPVATTRRQPASKETR